MKKTKLSIIIFLSLIFLLAIKVNAVGVSSEFYDGNPLPLKAGETRNIQLELQNMVGSEDVYLKADVTHGSEFATITDVEKIYFVPFGRKDVKVNLRVSIPNNIEPGMYKFTVSFNTVTPGQTSGTVRLGVGIDEIIPIRVNAPQPVTGRASSPLSTTSTLVIIILIIIAIVAFLILKKKKR